MYSCNSQSFLLEHFLHVDTPRPENLIATLQKLTNSPHLSRKILSSPEGRDLRARLSFLRSDTLNVLGCYLRSASIISGTNAGCAAIVMPVEGHVDFEVAGDHYLCSPWTPFIMEPHENFHVTLSEETHLLIIQLSRLTGPGYRPSFQRHLAALIEVITTFLYATPFLNNYQHAQSCLESLSVQLYGFTQKNYAPPSKFEDRKQISHDRRLCNAIRLLNEELQTPIDLESIASRAGLSLRNFHYHMGQLIGQSPYRYLQSRRLIKARESMIRSYPQNISVAQHGLDWGFQHPGRFSSYYHKHFGEYPSQTLRKLNQLEQLTGKVRYIYDESGNTSQGWFTSWATTAAE